ncbi:hypothetical protein OC844_004651 [Tilletia horrida]|nr:hypothetical protein OC844_004651 [Tilletia horrida]
MSSADTKTGLEGLVLYDLTNKPGGQLAFSPHCIKSVIDFKILGLPSSSYERRRLSFLQIRDELGAKVGPGTTVPTLGLADGQTHIVDSWRIAEWLAEHHPRGERIFGGGGDAGKRIAAFVNEFARSILSPHVAPMGMVPLAPLLDEGSREYVIDDRLTKPRFEAMQAALSSPEKRADNAEQIIKKLAPIEALLAAQPLGLSPPAPSSSSGPWLAGTAEPTHADACLFGYFVLTRADPAAHKAIWETAESLPLLRKWGRAMAEFCGPEIVDDFVLA